MRHPLRSKLRTLPLLAALAAALPTLPALADTVLDNARGYTFTQDGKLQRFELRRIAAEHANRKLAS